MAVDVTSAIIYRAKCTDCGWREDSTDRATIDRQAGEHDDMHDTSRHIAPVIADRVFYTDAPGVEFFGTFYRAAPYAVAHGYSYLTWNGWVYDAALADLSQRVCLAKDLPTRSVA
jgi:hypothetical protein